MMQTMLVLCILQCTVGNYRCAAKNVPTVGKSPSTEYFAIMKAIKNPKAFL